MPAAPAASGAPPLVARASLAGIALLTIDNPPINAINAAVRTALHAELERIGQDPDVTGVVIAAHGRLFSGGGDLREIGQPEPEDAVTMSGLARRIEGFAKPVVVAIGGRAIGGGILMALACHARVGTAAASIALPEVNLGFVPGAGGTQRLPRLVSTETALRMIVMAAPLGGEAAFAAGFFDALADSAGLIPAAAACCADIASGKRPWRRTCQLPVAPLQPAIRAALQERFHSEAQKAFPLREAPLAAAELVLGADADFDAGIARERAAFLRLSTGSQARALLHLFFAERALGGFDSPAVQGNAGRLRLIRHRRGRAVELACRGTVAPAAIAAAAEHVRKERRVPVLARHGSIAARLNRAFRTEVRRLLAEGKSEAEIAAAAGACGLPLPFSVPHTAAAPCPRTSGRLLQAFAVAARHCLQDGMAPRSGDIDFVAVEACGYPAPLGGPLFHADHEGGA